MRRWVGVATFVLILLALPVWAQRRGGGGGGSHASSGGFASRPAGSFHGGSLSHGSSFSHGSGTGLRIGNSYRGVYRRGRGISVRGSRYPYGYYPYLGYYGWYDSLDYSSDYQADDQTQDVYANAAPQVPYREDSGLQHDVQALNGKIDRLQADVEARNRPKSEEPETALVFQDKHVEEVRNYAISGGTLWVLNDQAAKKIPLAKLDLPATVKMNDDRGVDFEIPK
jgi:hypothetical protein